jgi:hypothetical protein
MNPGLEIFPSVSWNAIVHQYSTSPIEEVTFEIEDDNSSKIAYSLTFKSSDATVITLGFGFFDTGMEMNLNIFVSDYPGAPTTTPPQAPSHRG